MTKAEAKRIALWDVACWIWGAMDTRVMDVYTDSLGNDLSLEDTKLKLKAFEEIANEMERRSVPRKKRA